MKWFKFDTHTSNDPKLEKLRIKYGVEGYGLYIYCLELIAREVTTQKYTFELEHDSELIGHNLKMDSRRVEEILLYCVNLKLFQINKGNVITCFKLLKRLDDSTSKSPQIKELIHNGKKLLDDSESVGVIRSKSEKFPLEKNRIEEKTIEKNKIKEIKKELTLPSELNNPLFISKWDEWVIYKKEKKSKLTESTIKQQINFLSKHPLHTSIEIIDRSIMSGWIGLFPLKNNNSGSAAAPETTAERAKRIFV